MGRAVVVHVPVHGQVGLVDQLGAVHPDVVARRAGGVLVIDVNRVHAREGDVAALTGGGARLLGRERRTDRERIAVERPALDQRQPGQVDLAELGALHDLLAAAARRRASGPMRNSGRNAPAFFSELAEQNGAAPDA